VAGGDPAAERADLFGRLLRAQVRAGAVAAARSTRERAVDLDPAVRCRLLGALSFELAGEGDPRAAEAAREAVALARDLADPALLALAVAAEAWEASWDREPDRRARLATEIGRIGVEHDLVAYRWCAEHIAATAAAAGNDPGVLRDHIERGLELALAYQMPEPLSVGRCAQAMLAHVAGRFDDAERRYAEACAQMARHGSLHADGIAALATVTIRASQHREEAGAALDGAPPLRPDFYFSVFATLRGDGGRGRRPAGAGRGAVRRVAAGPRPAGRRGQYLPGDAAGGPHPGRAGPAARPPRGRGRPPRRGRRDRPGLGGPTMESRGPGRAAAGAAAVGLSVTRG
jgi:hypothetical protein